MISAEFVFAFAHIISVPKLKIARNCYFLYASHPDLEGIETANYYFASMVRFRSHHFGSEAKNSKKLLFSLRFSPRFRGDWDSKLYFASMVRFRHIISVPKLKIAEKLLFSLRFSPDLEGNWDRNYIVCLNGSLSVNHFGFPKLKIGKKMGIFLLRLLQPRI